VTTKLTVPILILSYCNGRIQLPLPCFIICPSTCLQL